jgi:hypothetical protein
MRHRKQTNWGATITHRFTLCAGCSGGTGVKYHTLQTLDGMSGGHVPLCPHCWAYWLAQETDHARQFLLDCLTATMLQHATHPRAFPPPWPPPS